MSILDPFRTDFDRRLQLQLLKNNKFDAVIVPGVSQLAKIAMIAHRDPLWDHSITKQPNGRLFSVI